MWQLGSVDFYFHRLAVASNFPWTGSNFSTIFYFLHVTTAQLHFFCLYFSLFLVFIKVATSSIHLVKQRLYCCGVSPKQLILWKVQGWDSKTTYEVRQLYIRIYIFVYFLRWACFIIWLHVSYQRSLGLSVFCVINTCSLSLVVCSKKKVGKQNSLTHWKPYWLLTRLGVYIAIQREDSRDETEEPRISVAG